MKRAFIDGSAGTTGLRIRERLASRKDIELIVLPDEVRKDPAARKDALWAADVAFLCLPDDAAREAAALAEGSDTVIIDTSTAHRTDTAWAYGFPELNPLPEGAKRIANPGCHASGFLALVTPLVRMGILDAKAYLTCFSLTGYSGGGKKMIAQYEAEDADPLLKGPRQYGLTQQHKHLKEMVHVSGIENAPVFCPIVGDFYSGMEVTVPVFKKDLTTDIAGIREAYNRFYTGPFVRCTEGADEAGFLSAAKLSGRDIMEITVDGNEERILLTARFDNLGKGASGSAIQNMNLALGFGETEGLVL